MTRVLGPGVPATVSGERCGGENVVAFLDDATTARLREDLVAAEFTLDAVTTRLGQAGLAALARNQTVAAVVAQPDKPAGRKQTLAPPPTKLLACERGAPVFLSRFWGFVRV